MKFSRRGLIQGGIAALFALSVHGAWADTYPSRPIELVVPYPPGASTDLIGRVIQQAMSAHLGQPVVIDNKGGAGGNLGAS